MFDNKYCSLCFLPHWYPWASIRSVLSSIFISEHPTERLSLVYARNNSKKHSYKYAVWYMKLKGVTPAYRNAGTDLLFVDLDYFLQNVSKFLHQNSFYAHFHRACGTRARATGTYIGKFKWKKSVSTSTTQAFT